jgi:hypothetical protein
MNTHAEKTQRDQSQSTAHEAAGIKSIGNRTRYLTDNRPEKQPVQRKKTKTVISEKPQSGENYDEQLTGIIHSLKQLQGEDEVKSDPKALKELEDYIEKATEVLNGKNVQAKQALIHSAETGDKSVPEDKGSAGNGSQQPVQRVIGGIIVGGVVVGLTIGYGIYRLVRRLNQAPPLPPGVVQDIPTTRAGFGRKQRYGPGTREFTDQEISHEVIRRTDHNHRLLYQDLIAQGHAPSVNIANLVQGVKDNNMIAAGAVCHDLTRFLIERRVGVRPTLDQLISIAGAHLIPYNIMGGVPLNTILTGHPIGTYVVFGDGTSEGHSITIVGMLGTRVVVAERHPANPVASLKYASTVEAELRLVRNNNPGQQAAIDRNFSTRVALH